uniref:Uncharacterized protein n=1 Tax=Arundo donax TaxID=35708 RepID=A0A0A8YAC7_ARUDO
MVSVLLVRAQGFTDIAVTTRWANSLGGLPV